MGKIIVALLFALILPAASFANDTMREGYWEITTSMVIPGMPMEMPATKIKHCYTKEDLKDQKSVITSDKNCTVTDVKQSGNKITWKMKCTGENAGTFIGETVYKGDAYDSAMTVQTQGQTMDMKVKGTRLGSCP